MNTAGSVLVDTNVVVAYFRGDKVLPPRFAEVTAVYLPWVVLGELHFGAQRALRREGVLNRRVFDEAGPEYPARSTRR